MNKTKLEMLSYHVVLNVLNKVRKYYGRDDRVSNQFTQELENDTKEIILKYLDRDDMEEEIKIEMDKSLAEQKLPCCKNCGYIEAEYCKFHFKTIDDIENTLCTEYELNH